MNAKIKSDLLLNQIKQVFKFRNINANIVLNVNRFISFIKEIKGSFCELKYILD